MQNMLSCVQIGLYIKSMASVLIKNNLEELKQTKKGNSNFAIFIDDDLYN